MNTKSLVVAFSMLAAGVVFAGSYVEYIDTSRSKKQVIDSGYVGKCSYKGYAARLHAAEGGVYTDFKINVVEN